MMSISTPTETGGLISRDRDNGAKASNKDNDALILATLTRIEGIGPRTLKNLLEKSGSPQALWEASETFLRANLSEARQSAFLRCRDEGLSESLLTACQAVGIRALALTDPDYPPLLREIHDPPLVLYVRGNGEALNDKTIGIVGTRKASDYGQRVTETLIEQMAPAGVCIVSGLAAGIDTCAHWGALRYQLPTVAVFGCGLDIIYPPQNKKLSDAILAQGGALVSEYPLGTPGTKYTYPQRNRIINGLSHGVLVVEGSIKSGALITARLALEEGRSVFTVPGNIFSPGSQGPLYLLKNGAVPVVTAEDILQELQWWLQPNSAGGEVAQSGLQALEMAQVAALSEEEQRVLRAISFDPMAIDLLAEASGLASSRINEILTLLELEELVVMLPGARVCRK